MHLRRRRVNLLQMPTRLVLPARGLVVADRCIWATRAGERLKGLIGRSALSRGEAMILSPGRQVHTFGMRDAIDVLFCTREWEVVHVARAMAPRRVSRLLWRAIFVVELPAGAAALVSPGDLLALEGDET